MENTREFANFSPSFSFLNIPVKFIIVLMIVRLIGCGAVGTVVADKLSQVSDFALIVDERRRKSYGSGIYLNERRLDLFMEEPSHAAKADLVIVAVKNFSLYDSLPMIEPFVKDDTVIMSLLNGIDAEGILSERFGEEKVLPSFITDLSSNHSGNETVCFSGGGTIVFGERSGIVSDRVKKIKVLFEEAGQRYIVPDDIMHEKWWKFMLNTCYNTLSAILDADYAAICDNQDFIRAVRIVAKEVQQVARAEGVTITQDDIELMIRRMASHRDHGKTSMLQDVEAGRESENAFFSGTVSRLAHQHGIDAPNTDLIYILLEARRSVIAKH